MPSINKWTLPLTLAALASPALAQLSTFRGTIPGSLHQCEETNLFFFDSGNQRPLDVLFLPSSQIPASLRTGTTTLDEALQYSPLLALSGIDTPDASEYEFTLQIAEGEVFEVYGFLPDGSGKALSLTRTVQTALPSASACLTNIPTTIAGAGITTSASASTATSASVTRSSAASSTTSSITATSTSASSSATSTSASSSSTGSSSSSESASNSSAAASSTPTGAATRTGSSVVAAGFGGLVVAVAYLF